MKTVPRLLPGVALLVLGSCLNVAGQSATSSDSVILERLAALEQRFDALAAENQELRTQLAEARASKVPDHAPITAAPPAPAKPEKAPPLYATAAGKETRLAIGGFLHLNAETGGTPDARWNNIDDRFFIRRARLNLSGSFAEDVTFKIEGDFGNNSISARSGYSAQATDVFATWKPSTAIGVRIGQFKTPFGYEQLMSDTRVPTVERSLPNDRLTISRQIGVGLFGDFVPKAFSYTVGMFNGNGVNNGFNDDGSFLLAGRLEGTLLETGSDSSKIRVNGGINAFTSDYETAVTRREGFGTDLQLAWGPFGINAEWLTNRFTTSTGTRYDSDGWSALAVWNIDKVWELHARFETLDSNTSIPGLTTDSWTLGGSYRLNGDNIKLTIDYLNGTIDGSGSDGRLLSRLQVVY